MTNKTLSQARIFRILARCRPPLAASRASERIWRLADRKAEDVSALRALSDALHEHRHVLLCQNVGSPEAAVHAAARDQYAARAARGAR
jgi:hypothetical protein